LRSVVVTAVPKLKSPISTGVIWATADVGMKLPPRMSDSARGPIADRFRIDRTVCFSESLSCVMVISST
jgi:hypothetical protein